MLTAPLQNSDASAIRSLIKNPKLKQSRSHLKRLRIGTKPD
jgi:hypothetical protein